MSEAQEIAKSHFRHYLPLFVLFVLPFSFSIVAYPTLQHSLATPHSHSYLFSPFSGDPFVFKPLSLFLLYISTLLCLSVCAIGTFTYSLYHGSSDQPVKFVDAIKSLSNSLMRLFATFFCAHAVILTGLLVIGLIVFGVTREMEYLLGFEIQYHGVCFWVVPLCLTMATQKLHIYDLMSEAQEIAKSHFRHYLPLFVLFILSFSFSIVGYLTLQHSLATPQSNSYLLFPFNGYPFVFKLLGLFLLYVSTLLCLSVCAIGTFTYSLYHGSSDEPIKFVDAIKSLSNSLRRLFATFFCAHAVILAGLLVIGLIVFGVAREMEYLLGFEIQYHAVCFWVVYVLCRVLLGLGLLCMYAEWVLAPVIVVAESSWGLEPLKRSAYLVKGNRVVVVRLLVFICSFTWLTLAGFGSWGSFIPFGSSVFNSTWVIVNIAFGSCMLATQLLHSLIAITILYKKCKAMQQGLPEQIKDDVNREYISLPLDEKKVAYIV